MPYRSTSCYWSWSNKSIRPGRETERVVVCICKHEKVSNHKHLVKPHIFSVFFVIYAWRLTGCPTKPVFALKPMYLF